ncbi:MAG: histidine phosphatase family protein [Casimicrobiaceae bacterium]
MRRAFVRAALACVAIALATPFSSAAAQAPAAVAAQSPPLSGIALRDALRRGGFVLYVRHTSTDFGQNDDGMTSFDDCTKQRNLTDKGRAEARAIGAAVARLKIPVGEVLASPYCRTLETGRLIFGRATPSMDARGGPATPAAPDRYTGLRKLLSTPVGGGTNLAISSHGNPFYAVAGPPYLAEGEVAIIEPLGASGFRIVAKITRDGWDALDKA